MHDGPESFQLRTPASSRFDGFQLSVMNGAGTYMGGAAALPLLGAMKFCIFSTCSPSPIGNISVPMNVIGQGGANFGAGFGGGAGYTVIGAPWTTGTAALPSGETMMGARHGAGSAMSGTAMASGQLQLVTPVVVRAFLNPGPEVTYGFFAVMSLHFVPEPTTAVLLASGIVALAVGGRRKRA